MNPGALAGFGRIGAAQRQQVPIALLTTPMAFSTASAVAAAAAAKTMLSGALTSGVPKLVLLANGKGRLNWAAIWSMDATARTHRMIITLDGTKPSIVDFTTPSISVSLSGYVMVGSGSYGASAPSLVAFQPLAFNRSCRIEIASSLTETDKATVAWNVEMLK